MMMTILTKTGLRWIWIAVLVVIFDQLSKLAILEYIPYGSGVMVTSFFNIIHVYNFGAAFSFLADANGMQRWLFSGLAFVIAVLLVVAMTKLPSKLSLNGVAYSMVVGGAIGNLLDRLIYGYVVDFLDFHWQDVYHFATFNIADCAISCGAVLIIAESLFKKSVSK